MPVPPANMTKTRRLVVPRRWEEPALRWIGHQRHAGFKFPVDERAAPRCACFFDDHLGQCIIRPLNQAVRSGQGRLGTREAEGQVTTRHVGPQRSMLPRIERHADGLGVQSFHVVDGDGGWRSHGRADHRTNVHETSSHQGFRCRSGAHQGAERGTNGVTAFPRTGSAREVPCGSARRIRPC